MAGKQKQPQQPDSDNFNQSALMARALGLHDRGLPLNANKQAMTGYALRWLLNPLMNAAQNYVANQLGEWQGRYNVRGQFKGIGAELLRRKLAGDNLSDDQQKLLDSYQKYYPEEFAKAMEEAKKSVETPQTDGKSAAEFFGVSTSPYDAMRTPEQRAFDERLENSRSLQFDSPATKAWENLNPNKQTSSYDFNSPYTNFVRSTEIPTQTPQPTLPRSEPTPDKAKQIEKNFDESDEVDRPFAGETVAGASAEAPGNRITRGWGSTDPLMNKILGAVGRVANSENGDDTWRNRVTFGYGFAPNGSTTDAASGDTWANILTQGTRTQPSPLSFDDILRGGLAARTIGDTSTDLIDEALRRWLGGRR